MSLNIISYMNTESSSLMSKRSS